MGPDHSYCCTRQKVKQKKIERNPEIILWISFINFLLCVLLFGPGGHVNNNTVSSEDQRNGRNRWLVQGGDGGSPGCIRRQQRKGKGWQSGKRARCTTVIALICTTVAELVRIVCVYDVYGA